MARPKIAAVVPPPASWRTHGLDRLSMGDQTTASPSERAAIRVGSVLFL
jgi:hypothetical protein